MPEFKPYRILTLQLLIFLFFLTQNVEVRAEDLPNPCNLLSASEIVETLGIQQPVDIDPTVYRNIKAFMMFGAGPFFPVLNRFLYLAFYPLQADEAICRGRAGDTWFAMQTMDANGTSLDKDSMPEWRARLEKYVKIVETTEDGITCRENLAPARGLVSPKDNSEIGVDSVVCSAVDGAHRVSIALIPQQATANPPVAIDKLRALTKLAATRI
jgi:hypothetical protein